MSALRLAVACAAFTAAAVTFARASAGPPEQTGTFALLGGTPKIVSKFWAVMGSGLSATLKVRQFAMGSNAPILDYQVENQRTIHMVVIRDDFATFNHLHPAFNTGTGTFSQPFTKEANHRYYVYADTLPRGLSQQVFRFTMESDGPSRPINANFAPSEPRVTAGPYVVTLEETTVAAGQEHSIDLTVTKGGKLATDLGMYLGAPAHCVFINTSTLQYVHVHPMVRSANTHGKGPIAMNMTGAGPLMGLHVPALPAGTYKLWVEFRGGGYKLQTAAFTIAAR